jgi:hypothetical protein
MQLTTIKDLPFEILDAILLEVVDQQKREGVAFTYGLSELPACRDKTVSTRLQKYVRGPTPPYQEKWDAVKNLRQVSQDWHEWALSYALEDVYVKLWQGGERWFDLTSDRSESFYFSSFYP